MSSSYIANNTRIHSVAVLFISLLGFTQPAHSAQPTLPQTTTTIKPAVTTQTISASQTLLASKIVATNQTSEQDFSSTEKSLQLADEIRRSKPVQFQRILNKLNNENRFTEDQRHLYNFLVGYGYTFNGQLDKAQKQFTKLLASNANELIKFRASYTLIHVYAVKKLWFEGLALLDKNINFAKTLTDTTRKNEHLTTTIIFYKKMKQYDLSLHYIKELLAQDLTPPLACIAQQLSIESRFHLKQLKSNDPAIYKALNHCEKINDTMVSSIIRVYQARAYITEQNSHGAIDSLLPFLAEIESTHYPELITGVNNILAEAYWQANDLENSKYFAQQSLLTNKDNSNVNQAAKTYKILYQIAKRENGTTLALNYHEQYAVYDKIDSDDIENKHLAFQLAKNKTLVQQSEIALLSETNKLLVARESLAETKLANRHLFMALLTFIIVILTLFGLRLWRDHKRVKQLAEYDPLTGAFNRGHFSQVSLSALKYCESAEQDLSLIMFDLDLFKKINDNHGHLCGDWALKQTVKACQAIGRQNDIFARLGGEEFCIVLPSCNIEVATLRAEACRVAIESIVTQASGCEFTITASFGVTDAKRSGFNLDKLLADADCAAYQSKHAGRNRVTVFQRTDEESEKTLDTTWSYN